MGKSNPQASIPFNNSNTHMPQPIVTPATKQVTLNNCQFKPPNSFPNSPKIQPHKGKLTPQASGPFNNSNTHIPHPSAEQATPNNHQGKPSNVFQNSTKGQPQIGMHNPQAPAPFMNPSGAPAGPQAFPNNCQGKPPNLFPNSPQGQPQMAMFNAQTAVPFNNSNTFMPQPNGALVNQQVPPNCLGNPPNLFPNSQIQQPPMAMINPQMQMQMRMLMQMEMQMQMQMLINNSNTPMINASGIPMLGNVQNGNQPFNQFFAPNIMNNFPMYQNAGFPMQNMNQFVQQPLPNNNQASPCNMPVYLNQVPQVLGPQNPTFNPNVQFCAMPTNSAIQPNNQNQLNLVNNVVQLAQGNNMAQPNLQLAPSQQSQNGFHPPVSNASQGNYVNGNGINSPQEKWKNPKDGLQKGFQKNSNMHNGKGAFMPHNKLGVKGHAGQSPNFASSINQTPVQPKKNLALSYTAHEIQQWREERKMNYPLKANIDKKQGAKMMRSEENERAASLRRKRLKEILDKQAQLGCEVAEIPSHYLSDSRKGVNEKEENTKLFGKNEKLQNKKFNKRRNRPKDRFAKKQKLGENISPNKNNQKQQLPLNKREPTLLQKLLSADIRRDKVRLLQVFRFMVMNSFFKDWPQTPLGFPLVMVKEAGAECEVVEEKPIPVDGVFGINEKVALEESTCVGDDENNNEDANGSSDIRSSDGVDGKAAHLGSLRCSGEAENKAEEEEEGEIVD